MSKPKQPEAAGRESSTARILEAVAAGAEQLLREPFSDAAAAATLERLGRAALVSRVYLFVNRSTPQGELVADQRVEWVDDGVPAQIDNPELQGFSYRGTDNEWLAERLRAGEIVTGSPDELPESFRRLLRAQQIESLLFTPVAVAGVWWGFVGFDDCRLPRRWAETEISALRVAASLLGAAIERQEAEADWRANEERLRQAARMEAWGGFAASLAQEFDGLMTTVRGYGERILDRLAASDALRADVAEILLAGERAVELTNELRAFGRQQPANPVPVALGRFLQQRLSMLRRLVGDGLELVLRASDDVETVWFDPNQLEQVLVTLLLNARDALEAPGQIVLSIGAADPAEIARHGGEPAAGASYLLLSMHDHRRGLDPETAARLFEPFVSSRELGSGQGLGLSTVYGIVRRSDGFIFVDGQREVGVVFDLFLPTAAVAGRSEGEQRLAAPLPQPTTRRVDGPAGAKHTGATVLLVEDEDLIRSLAEQILSEKGYRVLTAANASEALEIVGRHDERIDLLLTDIVMPGASGNDLAQRLLRTFPQMRVLYMSGYSDSLIFRYGVLQERAAFLQKPFSAEILESRVRQLLEG